MQLNILPELAYHYHVQREKSELRLHRSLTRLYKSQTRMEKNIIIHSSS